MSAKTGRDTWLVAVAAFTLFQSLVHMFVSGVALLQYECQLDWLSSSPTALFIRILYFHNPACGATVNIGQQLSGLPDQALVLMATVPFTTVRARWFMFAYLGLGAAWFAASLLLIVGAQRRVRGSGCHCYWSPWLALTGFSLFADFVGAATFLSDAPRTDTLAKLVAYVGATASGLGGQQVSGTWTAAVALGAYFGRAGVVWALHLLLFVLVFTRTIRLRVPPLLILDVEGGGGGGPRGRLSRSRERRNRKALEQALSQKARPKSSPPGTSPGTPSSTPAPGTPAPGTPPGTSPPSPRHVRRAASSECHPGPPRPAGRPLRLPGEPIPEQAAAVSGERIVFPESLLSLPQRLEQALSVQETGLRYAFVASTAVASAAAANAMPPPRAPCKTHLRRPSMAPTENEVAAFGRGQMPWTYLPGEASPHRMRDHLPPDEDLPPVPVPDYTLRPKRRPFLSYFRGASGSAGSAQISLPPPPPPQSAPAPPPTPADDVDHSGSDTNWRSNDVLY